MQKKSLGQSFLRDRLVAENIVNAMNISAEDIVLEIGGGDGALTTHITKCKYKELFVLELDEFYVKMLKHNLGHKLNTIIESGSILNYDIRSRNISCIIGAVPYYITSPIFTVILENSDNISKFGLIIQREVADKIIFNEKHGLSYWSLVSYYYDKKVIDRIPSHSFEPAPKVDSSSVLLTKNQENYVNFLKIFGSHKVLSKFSHLLFLNPRKILLKTFSKSVLEKSNIDEHLRPHQLKIEEAINLFKNYQSDNLKTNDKRA